jgi:hypothetical protein
VRRIRHHPTRWSRGYGEFAIIRAIVVVVSLEDGSSYRISRADYGRLS